MATILGLRMSYPATAGSVLALLTDADFVRKVATSTGGSDVEVTVSDLAGITVVRSARTLPAAVPSYAKALVGDTLRIEEVRHFRPLDDTSSSSGPVTVGFGSAPVAIEGRLVLADDDAGSSLAVTAEVKASVPFVGGKIERLAAEQVERYLRVEERMVGERLG